MWRISIGLAAALVILTNGLVEGYWTNRWHRPVELATGIDRLQLVPDTIGDWRVTHSEKIEEAVRIRAGMEGYIFRHYEDQLNTKKITVLLMCGRPGPLCVHTPDICYRGAGFRQDGGIEKWPQTRGDGSLIAEFLRAKFSKDDVTNGSSVRIAWSWGANGQWATPSTPRATFARFPVLYKLYVVQEITPASQRTDEEACQAFVEQLLPALNKALFASK